MPVNNETINKNLYDVLSSRGYDPIPLDSKGDPTDEIELADVFRFTYKDIDRRKKGQAWATTEGNELVLYIDDAFTENPEFESFTQFMKRWSQKRLLGFKITNKDHLINDMKKRTVMKKKEDLSEGYYPLNKKSSYSDSVPTVKMVIQHTRQIEEGEQRFRNVDKIFVENANGERFLVPTNRPGLARIYARHIAEGGTPYDDNGKHITSLIEEYTKMAGFVRATRNGQFNESALKLVNEGLLHYNNLRMTLQSMTGHRGYNKYFESYTPMLNEETEDAITINELFVQEKLDPRIESVLPILNRLNKNITEISEVKELEEWASDVTGEQIDRSKNVEESMADDPTVKRLTAMKKLRTAGDLATLKDKAGQQQAGSAKAQYYKGRVAKAENPPNKEESVNEANEKQIRKDLDSGMSTDAVIGKHANKKLTNTDEIRKIIKQHAWDKRTKKQGVTEESDDEVDVLASNFISQLHTDPYEQSEDWVYNQIGEYLNQQGIPEQYWQKIADLIFRKLQGFAESKQGVKESSGRDLNDELKQEIRKSMKMNNGTRLFYYNQLFNNSDLTAATSYENFINSWAGNQWFKKYESEIKNFVNSENKRFLKSYKVDRPKESMNEDESFGSYASLKDWKQWNVMIMNNYYDGKHSSYSGRPYRVVADSPEEAKKIVLDNADYVLKDILTKKFHSGKKILSKSKALPIIDKRVTRVEPGSLSTTSYVKILTPNGPMMLSFDHGNITGKKDEEQGVEEGKTYKDAKLNAPRSPVAKNAPKSGAGAHTDKSKTIPRKEKYKKNFDISESFDHTELSKIPTETLEKAFKVASRMFIDSAELQSKEFWRERLNAVQTELIKRSTNKTGSQKSKPELSLVPDTGIKANPAPVQPNRSEDDFQAYVTRELKKELDKKGERHLKSVKEDEVEEDLDANQKRVGQLGPTEKVKNNNIGKLVGANESIEMERLKKLSGL
jgi:hypothetical protein